MKAPTNYYEEVAMYRAGKLAGEPVFECPPMDDEMKLALRILEAPEIIYSREEYQRVVRYLLQRLDELRPR